MGQLSCSLLHSILQSGCQVGICELMTPGVALLCWSVFFKHSEHVLSLPQSSLLLRVLLQAKRTKPSMSSRWQALSVCMQHHSAGGGFSCLNLLSSGLLDMGQFSLLPGHGLTPSVQGT